MKSRTKPSGTYALRLEERRDNSPDCRFVARKLVSLATRSLSWFESPRLFHIKNKNPILADEVFIFGTPSGTQPLSASYLLADPKALPFGTRLRTKKLKSLPPATFLTFFALSVFESPRLYNQKNKPSSLQMRVYLLVRHRGLEPRTP